MMAISRRRFVSFMSFGLGIYLCFVLYIFCVLQIELRLKGLEHAEDSGDSGTEGAVSVFRRNRYEAYQRSSPNRSGAGEQGQAVSLTPDEQRLARSQRDTEGYNLVASDKMALDRSLSDVRHAQCKAAVYPKELPTASVIIIFANEAVSVLMRTVHGIINRTPPEYLHEVILVDDASDRPGLGPELDEYINSTWPDNMVRVVRLPERSGLIRARLAGARVATGDALVVLDGHIEVNQGWAEPLLARLKQNNKLLVTPAVDGLDPNTLKYNAGDAQATVTFRWDMHYEWMPYANPDPLKPIISPDLVGCAFAMDRKMFFELGSFDEEMDIWGCENTEIALRMWMCAAGVEIIPCSRMAHLFRFARPYKMPSNDFYGKNSQRVAEVWLGDYKKYYYMTKPERQGKDYGDISRRVALRDRLKCRDFQWVVDHVWPQTYMFDVNATAWGKVRNKAVPYCLDTFGGDEQNTFPLSLFPCQDQNKVHFTQLFSLSTKGHLRRQFTCATYFIRDTPPGHNVSMTWSCDHQPVKAHTWNYNPITQVFIHNPSTLCLDAVGNKFSDRVTTLNMCTGADSQKWTWDNFVGT